MFEKAAVLGLALVASAFAGGDFKNICDSLKTSENPKVRLVLDHVDETVWTTDRSYSSVKNKVTYKKRVADLVPQRNAISNAIPVYLEAACGESTDNKFAAINWSDGNWALDWKSYASNILDMREATVGSFSSENTNNMLMMSEGSLPTNGSYKADQLLPSKEYEFNFEWWFASVVYTVVTVNQEIKPNGDTLTTTQMKFTTSNALGNDSSSILNTIMKSDVASDVSEVTFQVWKGVLVDSAKLGRNWEETFTATPEGEISSSSYADVVPSSSSEAPGSSSSTTAIYPSVQPRVVNTETVQMRRLDGTLVKGNSLVAPGVYYVKQKDGRWKKQMVLQR